MLVALIVGLVVLGCGWAYQALGQARDAQRFPAPGRLVDIGGGERLHVWEQGCADSPPVLFEAGIAGSSIGWALVQPEAAQFAHAVSYDRAGLGWSGPYATLRTCRNMVEQLHDTLQTAGIRGPLVLVGHSFGGLLARVFAQRYPDQAAALVLIDPVSLLAWANPSEAQRRRLATGAALARRGAVLARFGVVRGALAVLVSGGRILPRLIARASAGQGNGAIQRLVSEVQKLPAAFQPIIAAHWSRRRAFHAMAAYLEALPESAQAALLLPLPPHIPCTILSAANATAEELAERDAWAGANPRSRHRQIPGTGHWIQLERPDLVIEAIRDALGSVG